MKFRSDLSKFFLQLFLIVAGLTTMAVVTSMTTIALAALLVVVSASYFISNIRNPSLVEIDEAANLIVINYYGSLRARKKINLNEASFTFKKEMIARGMKAKTLRMFHREKLVFELLPGSGGWDEKTLAALYEKVTGNEIGEAPDEAKRP
jgi:hypothetical protein